MKKQMTNKRAKRTGGYRHLIYFIDGTWLWAGSDASLDVYSNVYRLNTLLNADDGDGHAQIVHYSRGLGAVKGLVEQYSAGGFAAGIDELIADLYVNICSNYEPNDKIYIFGFSRGAVVARALTGLLSFGILDARHINAFADVWAAYSNQSGEILLPGQGSASIARPNGELLDYSASCAERHPRIEFVGVFDTVAGGNGMSAIAQKLRLAAGGVQPNVRHAVQLLAIDESRKLFQPILWTGTAHRKLLRDGWEPTTLEQIWMPGVHSDVGGAYSTRHLGDLSLLTMIDRVIARTPLSFDLDGCRELQVASQDPIRVHNEHTNKFRFTRSHPRRIDNKIAGQSIHPIVKHMRKAKVHYKQKGKLGPYPLEQSFHALPDADEFLTTRKFRSSCGDFLKRYR